MTKNLPMVALRGMTILPEMIIHFDINRKKSIKAIEKAMLDDQTIFLVTQRDGEVEEPIEEDVYRMGIVGKIKQVIKLPNNIIRVLIEGKERALLDSIKQYEPYLVAEVFELEDSNQNETIDRIKKEAMLRHLKETLEIYGIENAKIGKEVIKQLLEIKEIDKLLVQIANNVPFHFEQKQIILETIYLSELYEKIAIMLEEEIDVIKIKKDIQLKLKEKVDKNQRDYILREQLKVIREELGENNTQSDAEEFLQSVDNLKASEDVKEKIRKEIERFKNISSNSSESAVLRGYIETLLEMPWNKLSRDNKSIKNAQKILDNDHYGMEKVKTRILEFLAVRTLTDKGDSPIICLVGPPGTGKTSIAKSVAKALNKEYVRICLGGVRDEAEIRGHRKTYVGAMSGRIATGLKSAGVKNPLMLLDEIDKVSSDHKGDTSSALLEVLDSEQNNKFRDHYIEIPIDLSEVLFIATANTTQTIPKPLLDRMEIIDVSSYTQNEKVHIAKEHLLEKQIKKNGLKPKQLTISTKAIEAIIKNYTREAGVRNLERKLGEISRKAAREILEEDKKIIKISEKNLEKYLGKEKYTYDNVNEKDEIGIVRGLAWTSVGGDTLQIEVNIMPGKGVFELTGQLGDIMKESAKTGISYIRSISEEYKIDKEFFANNDIHIHIPEGAVPKDGPSAGITMATAMISAITKKPVKASVAMTGEITLRGRVLPIGGLKEKILAAKTAKIKTVLVPKKNTRDISEISEEILGGVEIKYVETMDDVLKHALSTN